MHIIDHFVETATRQFTDRQKPRALFEDSIKKLDQTKLISYYGIGGIGKTRLLSVLKSEAQEHVLNPLCISVDFEESYFRNIGEFLNTLKFQIIAQEKIDFYAFDLAYAIYWARTQPGDIPMEKSQTFIQEDHILFDILDSLDGIPYANLIPKAINLMSKIPKHTKKSNWWKSTGSILAAQIHVIDDIQTLRDILLDLWVGDVIAHFQNKNRKLVFFFDSFESVDLNRLPRIKTLTTKFEKFPVLFVVGSRNKLNWESTEHLIVDEHIVGELSPEDMRSFLQACNIRCLGERCSCQKQPIGTAEENMKNCVTTHEEIIKKIIHVTNGIPIYLDLMVDTYMQIRKTEQPKPEHFSENRNEIVPLLLKHFSPVDLAFLELLSFPNHWNYPIVKLLVREFNPGVSLSQIGRFYEYSFIMNDSPKHVTMQKFIRQWLQQQMIENDTTKEFYHDVHHTLYTYYDEQFSNDPTYERFKETAYHAQQSLSVSDFELWLQTAIEKLLNKGFLEGIIDYLQKLFAQQALSKQVDAFLHMTLLSCYMQVGKYQEIIDLASTAINKANEANKEDYRSKIQYLLGSSYYAMSEYEQAIKFYKLSSANVEHPFQSIDAHMKIGKIAVTIKDLDTAKSNYLQASQLVEQLRKTTNNSTELNSLAGQCYEKLGELMAYLNARDKQLQLYKQSIHYLKMAVAAQDHPHYLQHLTLLGFSTKRLAEAYEMINGDAIGAFKEAISYYEEVLEAIPNSVDTLEKLGHACADLMRVARVNNQFNEFSNAFNKGEQAFSKVIKIAPQQGSSINRLSSIMLEMAQNCMNQHDYAKAKIFLQKSLHYNELTFQNAAKYAYAEAKKKAIFESITRYEQETKQSFN